MRMQKRYKRFYKRYCFHQYNIHLTKYLSHGHMFFFYSTKVPLKPVEHEEPRTPSTISKEDSIDSVLKRPAIVELELVLNREG